MQFVKTRMKPELFERMKKDMDRSKRGIQAELEYLVERGLAVIEAEERILEGKSQIDLAALRGLAQREGAQG